MDTSTDPTPVKPRKRKANPEQWKDNARKRLRVAGEAHTSRSGTYVPPRVTGPSCNCRLKCPLKFSDDERHKILTHYNKLDTGDAQRDYLASLIQIEDPKRVGAAGKSGSRVMRHGSKPFQRCAVKYFVTIGGKRVRVCKQYFSSLHGLSPQNSVLRQIVQQVKKMGFVTKDGRGKHSTRPHRLTEEVKGKVHQHISSFPAQKSHYSRAKNPDKKYLAEDLNVSRMYNLFLEENQPEYLSYLRQLEDCRQKQIQYSGPVVKPMLVERSYRKIFDMEFNLGFGQPRSDTCVECDSLHIKLQSANEEEKQEIQMQIDEHHAHAEFAYAQLKSDTQTAKQSWSGKVRELTSEVEKCSVDAVDMYSFDFEQNLPCPNIQNSEIFYMRQMWLYNFGVHDAVDNTATMMVWAENEGKRGSCEVASCLRRIFDVRRSGAKHLILWSDGCAGQNKNHTMVGFLASLAMKGEFSSINHKFLVRGHTYLPNDRDFAQVEKQKAVAQVHLPQDWIPYIQKAKKKHPFMVHSLSHQAFYDYKTFASTNFFQLKKTTAKKTVKFKQIQWFSYGESSEDGTIKSHPNEVWIRYSLNDSEPWGKVKVLKNRSPGEPTHLHTGQIPLKPAKVKDLVKIANKFLPPSVRPFYTGLTSTSSCSGDMDDYGNEDEI